MMMSSRREIVEEVTVNVRPERRMEEEMIYVSFGKNMRESISTLRYASNHREGKKLCILHVHQPSRTKGLFGADFPISQAKDDDVKASHESAVEKLHIEMNSIEKGLVKLISLHGIRKLVMGAAAERRYSRRMTMPKSKKAIYVNLKAPAFCHIWFVCKEKLIYTRRGDLDRTDSEVSAPAPPPPSIILSLQPSSMRSKSVSEVQNGERNFAIPTPDFRRIMSECPSPDVIEDVASCSRLNTERRSDASDAISRKTASSDSPLSTNSSDEVVKDLTLISFVTHSEEHLYSPPYVLEFNERDKLYDKLQRTMVEAESSRKEAFQESVKRMKAEKDMIEAIRWGQVLESSYAEELRRRKEAEETVASGKEELQKLKTQLDKVMEELRFYCEQKSSLEIQIKNSDQLVQELEQKIFSVGTILQNYKKEIDELQVERDNALNLAEELRRKQVEDSTITRVIQFYSEFSYSEIEAATLKFDPSLKIGEGGYGSVYKGLLRHTKVAIKRLNSCGAQGPLEFQQEVNVLSKLRHPNIVTFIGACPEDCILVYEYLPNGSVEDRLARKGNTPPLSWQTRIRIAKEQCSALIFLHSCESQCIIHGDLKPANILLDMNFVSKLSDFGICRVLSRDKFSSNSTTLCHRTNPKGTLPYLDPEFVDTGELTRKSDVYSFGIILLRLLTGRSAVGITIEVQSALDKGNLKPLLNPTAGEWPLVQAKQLIHLAMSCCEKTRSKRPDVASLYRILESMGDSRGATSSGLGSHL